MKLLNRLSTTSILILILMFGTQIISQAVPPTPPCGSLNGIIINSMNSTTGWNVGAGNGASAPQLTTTSGYTGTAVQMNYNLGTNKGAWAQMRIDFNPPLDISAGDHLRFIYTGTGDNSIEIGMVSTENPQITSPNYFASSWNRAANVPWWAYATWDYQDFRKDGESFPDFSQVKAIFISITNTAVDDLGASGSIIIDELQILDLATRTVPTNLASLTVNQADIDRAATWIGLQQQSNGLLKSWYEETLDYSWLYDQALGLLILAETDLLRARLLFNKLHALQLSDGSWYVGYHYASSPKTMQIESKKDIGPIAWLIYALTRYSFIETDSENAASAYEDARQGAAWLAKQVGADGSVSVITEWNLDAWWAFHATGYQAQANNLRDFLLDKVWDSTMGRFKASSNTYQIFLDNQTWGAPFLRAMGRDTDVRRALSYAQATLLTLSNNESRCAFDGAGPFSVWNEGTYQYIAMRGNNSQFYWDELVSQQATGGALDGALPNSPDNYSGYIDWLSTWHGIAPTAWFYFAGTAGPFTLTPPAPANAAPQQNYFTTSTPSLAWNHVTGTEEYEIQVSTGPTFTLPLTFSVIVPLDVLYLATEPLNNGTYYWRVRARKGSAFGAWSNVESFVVNAP